MYDLANDYVNNILETDEAKRLLELKKIIDTKYASLIINLKTKESLYNESLEYGDYYKDKQKIKNDFIEAKAKLYSKEEVKQYFDLERKLNKMINDDLNALKESISNKIGKNNFVL